MIKAKVLFTLSGILGAVFVIIFISVATSTDRLSISAGIFASIIVILLIGMADVVYWLFNSRKKVKEINKGKQVTPEVLKALSDELLFKDYSEYEGRLLSCDMPEMGSGRTPIYIRIFRGQFEEKIYGVVINTQDLNRKGIEEYDDSVVTRDEIKMDILRRANLAAFAPKEQPLFKTMSGFNPFTGTVIQQQEPLPDFKDEKKEGGGLK